MAGSGIVHTREQLWNIEKKTIGQSRAFRIEYRGKEGDKGMGHAFASVLALAVMFRVAAHLARTRFSVEPLCADSKTHLPTHCTDDGTIYFLLHHLLCAA